VAEPLLQPDKICSFLSDDRVSSLDVVIFFKETVGTITKGKLSLIINAWGYDAMTQGNHEFDIQKKAKETLSMAKVSIVSCIYG
jgi:hypothetical protein